MSADNWAVCPQCKARKTPLEKIVYGKVSEQDYLASLNKKEKEPEPTLREDWYIGTDSNGIFCITYRSSCGVCKLYFTFRHQEQIKLRKESK